MLRQEVTSTMMSLNKKNKDGASSCSVTSSQCSHRDNDDDKDGSDSDYESDHGEDRFDHLGKLMNIRWIGPGRTIPILVFNAKSFFSEELTLKNVGVQHNLACKVTGDSMILREILAAHGFREVSMVHRRYNLAWTGRHTKPSYVKRMANCHVINHFPRTEELTRKDKLYKNIIKMQEIKGKEHFDFVPVSFKMPSQYRSLRSHYKKERGLYIVKPVSLSRGRGVFVIDNPKKINSVHVEGPGESHHETRHKKYCQQIYSKPFGHQCEGLTRFATVKYNLTSAELNERCMHLTNYSINMENEQYIKNIDSKVENEGSKWSLGALLRYFKSQGKDTSSIMQSIEDVVIKTILSVEWKVGAACKRYMRHRHNCFELFGFDILLDDKYKPWLIEVNLSPSLGCDTPLDVKVKTNMLCDLLNLVGIRCYDPHMQNLGSKERRTVLTLLRNRLKAVVYNSYGHYYYRICRDACHRAWGLRHSRQRLKTMLDLENNWASHSVSQSKRSKSMDLLATLTPEEVEIIQKVREEESRRFGWVRIFPTSDSWDTYHTFMDFPTTNNLMLHQRLYPERHKVMTAGRSKFAGLVTPSPSVNELFFQVTGQRQDSNERINKAYIENLQRIRQYETPLSAVPPLISVKNKIDSNPSWNESIEMCEEEEKLVHERIWRQNEKMSFENESISQVNCSAESSVEESQKIDDQATLQPIISCDVAGLLDKGYVLSHIQARIAFTGYLLQVHKLLLMDIEGDTASQDNVDNVHSLMTLITHFLKQSIQFLNVPLHLEFPEEFTSMRDQRLHLAKSLSLFIKLYIEETNAKKTTGDQVIAVKSASLFKDGHNLDDQTFDQYIYTADINELEKILSQYSQQHDPVTTFLGNKPGGILQTSLS